MSAEVRWASELRTSDGIIFRVGRTSDGLVAEWPGRLVLRCGPQGESPVFTRCEGVDTPSVERLERGLGQALLGHLRGVTSLHASVVAKGGRALALVGESGRGKSTAAAALVAAESFELLRDDIAPLSFEGERVFIAPGDAEHSLHPRAARALGLSPDREQADGKVSVRAPFAASPAELAAIVTLRFAGRAKRAPRDGEARAPSRNTEAAGDIVLRRVRGLEAVAALVPSVVRFVVDDPARNADELTRLGAICGKVPIFELLRRRDLSELRASCRALTRLVERSEA